MRRSLVLAALAALTARPSDRLTAQHILPPAAVLGFEPGTDSMLARWREVSGYLNLLAAASPYVRVDTLGRTTEGRPFQLVTITSPANQARLANGAVCPESACISRGRRVSTRAGRGGYLNSMASVIRQFATVIYLEATSGRGSM